MKEKMEIVYWIVSILILAVSAYAIYWGPIKAVKIGRQLDDDYNKLETKKDLFLTLFALRGSPVHVDFVESLNQIEIVFQDEKDVLDAWHRYFDALNQTSQVNQEETWALHRTELLSKMAISLGYRTLSQTDIMKHYYPEGHWHQVNQRYEFYEAQRKFYVTGEILNRILIELNSETQQEEKRP